TLGLKLGGPFEILAGAHKAAQNSKPNFHFHWRFVYDPPEFQTILWGNQATQHHIGCYRDIPESLPSFLGENEAKTGYTITQMGDNVFAAVLLHLLKRKKERSVKKAGGEALEKLEAQLRERAETLGLSVEQKSKAMKQQRQEAGLKKICKAIVEAHGDEERIKAFGPIQEMITFVQFANDECDYGMGYELGIDLFCYGSHYFHKIVRQLLPMAYNLLKRNLFGEILEAHLSKRSQDNLDQLSS
ncbi:unnamed protein product, partial [Tetraodon nigroviridis]